MSISPPEIVLREATWEDVGTFFEHQQDPEAAWRVGFGAKDRADRQAFNSRWRAMLADDAVEKWAIEVEGQVVGQVISFERYGLREVGYWLAREAWGKGIATAATTMFLQNYSVRPVYARVAADNVASLRVVEKLGFRVLRYERDFADGRGEELEEAILVLDA